jgi:hypothetical protein
VSPHCSLVMARYQYTAQDHFAALNAKFSWLVAVPIELVGNNSEVTTLVSASNTVEVVRVSKK